MSNAANTGDSMTKNETTTLAEIGRGIVTLWADAPGSIPSHLVGELSGTLDDGTDEYLAAELGTLGLTLDGLGRAQERALNGGLVDAVDAAVAAIAAAIVAEMCADEKATYTRDGWAEGVGHMLQGEWDGADRSAVLDAIDAILVEAS